MVSPGGTAPERSSERAGSLKTRLLFAIHAGSGPSEEGLLLNKACGGGGGAVSGSAASGNQPASGEPAEPYK